LELGELPVAQLDRLLKVYQHRTLAIGRLKKIEYILIFKNHGGKAGASLVHAHSQIFATGFVPPHIILKLKNVRAYKIEHGACYYCDTLKKEGRSPRKILTNRYVTAFAPYASSYPYEAWLMPNRHLDNLTRLNPTERQAFAQALHKILKKLNSIRVSYNFYLHQTLTDKDEHFYLRISPREQTWGGVEVGSRLIINSVAPEDAARFYRSK
jgi:UDPglucose--hexose-1-phosphate uridylyltransferase